MTIQLLRNRVGWLETAIKNMVKTGPNNFCCSYCIPEAPAPERWVIDDFNMGLKCPHGCDEKTIMVCTICDVEAVNKGGEHWSCLSCDDYDGIEEVNMKEWYK